MLLTFVERYGIIINALEKSENKTGSEAVPRGRAERKEKDLENRTV